MNIFEKCDMFIFLYINKIHVLNDFINKVSAKTYIYKTKNKECII